MRQMLISLFSAKGISEMDLMASLQNQWPTGPDPSQVMFGTNF
jgi:hypothetical protein